MAHACDPAHVQAVIADVAAPEATQHEAQQRRSHTAMRIRWALTLPAASRTTLTLFHTP